MKYMIFLFAAFLFSCSAGTSKEVLQGNESNLPQELKGLKVYKVWVEDGNYVNVAFLNNQINSLSYPQGKSSNSTTFVINAQKKVIEVKEIISENDSIIVCKK